jgi:hypothetical protein
MTHAGLNNAAVHYLGSDILLFGDGATTMTENASVECGQSARLVRARRYFIESYLRLHDFGPVYSREEDTSVVFSMTTEGRTYSVCVSQAWLLASTHGRVEERLDRLHICRQMREHGAVYLDVTGAGQDLLCPSR